MALPEKEHLKEGDLHRLAKDVEDEDAEKLQRVFDEDGEPREGV